MSTFRQVIYVIEISDAYCDLVKTTELYVVILGIEIKRTIITLKIIPALSPQMRYHTFPGNIKSKLDAELIH